MKIIEIPFDPLWPLVFSMCATAKSKGVELPYEVAEAIYINLVQEAEKELNKGTDYGDLGYPIPPDVS